MEKITGILAKKQPHLHAVSPACTAGNALNQMCCENVEYLVVLDDDDRYMGLITEHDIASGVVVANKKLDDMKVSEVMNKRLPVATTDYTVEKCMQLMRQHNVRFVPVFENFAFRGVVSVDDILEEAVSHRVNIFDTDISRAGRFGMLT